MLKAFYDISKSTLFMAIIWPIAILFLVISCDRPYRDSIVYEFVSKSDELICILIPERANFYGTRLSEVYGDSTILTAYNAGYHTSFVRHLRQEYSGYYNFNQMAPNDTFRVFITEKFSIDDYRKEMMEMFQEDRYLQRYDLLIEDFNILFDKERNVLQIPYPPDKRMKDMIMWPRYQEHID